QIARQFLARNYLVVYLYKFPKAEYRDLQLPVWHPRLLHSAVSAMDWKAFLWQYGDLLDQKRILTLVEFPLKDFFPYIESIKEHGGKVIYDFIDDWKSSLGKNWYTEDVEKKIVQQADLTIATAQELVRDLGMRTGREVHLLPNAVNLDLFNRRMKYERPNDLPHGDLQIIYIGALWGEWFDWQLLERVADRFPTAAVTVIGDYDGRAKIQSQNVYFLGLKEQQSLPPYLSHSDVAIIPWKINPLTQATSPLKVFEYLAMGLPVVAPNLEPLGDMPYVFRASTQDEFLDAIQRARDIEIDLDKLDEFISENSWTTRVNWLIEHTRML
ncbi:MAG: glycosyltransferase, partial [Anaerolineales bacterium]